MGHVRLPDDYEAFDTDYEEWLRVLDEQNEAEKDSAMLGTRVDVYYNLHKHTFSIRDKQTRRVIGHSRYVELVDCKLKVSEAGRQRVLREKKKNVHATIEGTLVSTTPFDPENHVNYLTELTYNPYRFDSFVRKEDKTPVTNAGYVVFNTKRIWGEGLQ